MIQKSYSKSGKTCRITFEIPAGTYAKKAFLCGDFTEWEKTCITMKRRKDGSFATSVTLQIGRNIIFAIFWMIATGRMMNPQTGLLRIPMAAKTVLSMCKADLPGYGLSVTSVCYLAGGIPPRILSKIDNECFKAAVANKGRFSSLLSKNPRHVIVKPDIALFGAACHGFEQFETR